MDYIGLKCGICFEDFKDGDDVVVCPDCGTPMHRACYKQMNACPNAEKHKDGYVFDGFGKISDAALGRKHGRQDEDEGADRDEGQSENDGEKRGTHRVGVSGIPGVAHIDVKNVFERSDANGTECPICGNRNRPRANFCDNCGARISSGAAPSAMTLDDNNYSDPKFFASYVAGRATDIPAVSPFAENITAGDVACFVGVNAPYYLGAFKRIQNGSGKFNFSAAVFSGVWFLYRKLYKLGALMLSLQALLYALRVYFTQNVSLAVMNKLLAAIGLSASNMSSLTMEQYMQLSAEMQKLPFNEQLIMMMPTFILIMQIAVMVISGALANKTYYKNCIRRITELKNEATERSLSRKETSQELYLSGGVNMLLAAVFGVIYLFLLFM